MVTEPQLVEIWVNNNNYFMKEFRSIKNLGKIINKKNIYFIKNNLMIKLLNYYNDHKN
jgi:hypothetical protein